MAKYTNQLNLPLPLAVWLARDEYGHDPRPNVISVTTLMKPLKEIVLSAQNPVKDNVSDVSTLGASRIGTAIHNGIEKAWLENHKKSLTDLGFPKRVIDRIVINPPKGTDLTDKIPIYMEQRAEREIDGFILSGKFDFGYEGKPVDFKSTSVYTYINKTNDAKYKLQGSLYKFLNPDIFTSDIMEIHFIFKDWSAAMQRTNKNYPPQSLMAYPIQMMSLEETENWARQKVHAIKANINNTEENLPACTDEELWRKEATYKYYKNPAKTTRATKNFTTLLDANKRLAEDGHVGIVREVKGAVVACRFCSAANSCKQKDAYIDAGILDM